MEITIHGTDLGVKILEDCTYYGSLTPEERLFENETCIAVAPTVRGVAAINPNRFFEAEFEDLEEKQWGDNGCRFCMRTEDETQLATISVYDTSFDSVQDSITFVSSEGHMFICSDCYEEMKSKIGDEATVVSSII